MRLQTGSLSAQRHGPLAAGHRFYTLATRPFACRCQPVRLFVLQAPGPVSLWRTAGRQLWRALAERAVSALNQLSPGALRGHSGCTLPVGLTSLLLCVMSLFACPHSPGLQSSSHPRFPSSTRKRQRGAGWAYPPAYSLFSGCRLHFALQAAA